jgi:hypothetical protein
MGWADDIPQREEISMRLTKQAKSDAGLVLRCGFTLEDVSYAAKVLRSIPSEKRAEQSRVNGAMSKGRPKGSGKKGIRHE